jgi:predicted nucleic acid-binding protein
VHVYFDASVVVSLIIEDAHSERADLLAFRLAPQAEDLIASFWTLAETASVVAARVRDGALTRESAAERFANVRAVTFPRAPEPVTHADTELAWRLLAGLDQTLRAPDALHLAVARRLGATLATFDKTMADAARALGLEAVDA